MQRKLRLAIVEDEMIIAADMQDILQELGYDVCEITSSYQDALLLAKEQQPDLFLLDINLKSDKNGIDIARSLQGLKIPFVFVTSHADNSLITAAKETRPFGYLIKPFTKQDLFATIEMAMGHISYAPPPNNLFVPTGKGKQQVALKDIQYVKANGNYVEIKMENRRIVLRKNLKEFESKLPHAHPFLRVHKSFLVNKKHIIAYNQLELVLKDDTKIPIGRTYFTELRNMLSSI